MIMAARHITDLAAGGAGTVWGNCAMALARRVLLASCSVAAMLAAGRPAQAQTTSFTITDFTSLNNAIASIDVGGANAAAHTNYTFNFAANSTVGLASALAAINLASGSSLTINGNTSTIDGNGSQRGLLVFSGNVAINNLAITNAQAQGGSGGNGGSFGGGGGAGLGGALFVASGAQVSVSNVSLTGNNALGGNGGNAGVSGATGSGGGGGLGGNGGSGGGSPGGGGGGGVGVGSNGGNGGNVGSAGIVNGAASGGNGNGGGAAGGLNGGGGGGGGGSGGVGGGGGVSGGSGISNNSGGSDGGFGGGGGAAAANGTSGAGSGSNGGFGGGGSGGGGAGGISHGGTGGLGGFGGGGGAGAGLVMGGLGGFGGGTGGGALTFFGGGGGGLGAGGAIFVQQGGTLTLAGALSVNGNSVTGGNGGTGGASGTAGTASSAFGAGIFIQGNNTITFAPGAGITQTINDVIADQNGSRPAGGGSGGIAVTGGGRLVLAGANTYAGSTTVNGGTLEVDGSIASSTVTVNAGGTLSGIGIVDPAVTTIIGTLAPGNAANPTGTMTITGNLVFQSAVATYLIGINGANAAQTVVTGGSATLNGASVRIASGSVISPGTKYTILTASGGVIGTFNPHVASGIFTGALSYDPNDVFLTFIALPTASGLNVNQQNVAAGLSTFFSNGGGLPLAFFNLLSQGGASLANSLTQVSGETATGSQQTTFNAMGQFMGLMSDPFINRGGGGNPPLSSGYAEEDGQASAYAATKKTDAFAMFTKASPSQPSPASGGGLGWGQRWSVWAAGFGGSQSTGGNAVLGSNNTTSNIAATAVGADYLISPTTIAGFALAGGGTSFSVANGGTGRSDLFQMGAYVRHNQGPAYVSAALAYGWQDITTNRTVTVAGFDKLRAEFNANAWSGRLEGGYRLVSPAIGGIGITPYAAAQFVTFDLPAYAEQAIIGTNNFALTYNAKDVTDVRTEFGIRTDRSFAVDEGILTLRGRLAWAHDYDGDRNIAATFQSLPGASFVVNGAAQAADSTLTTASIEMKWKNGWSAAATFEGEFSAVTNSHAGKGVIRYVW